MFPKVVETKKTPVIHVIFATNSTKIELDYGNINKYVQANQTTLVTILLLHVILRQSRIRIQKSYKL